MPSLGQIRASMVAVNKFSNERRYLNAPKVKIDVFGR